MANVKKPKREPLGATGGQELNERPGKQIGGEPVFKYFTDGHGYEVRVVNLRHPMFTKREGVVEVEAIKKKRDHGTRYSMTHVYDPELGAHFGIPIGIDERTKEIRWRRFILEDFQTYNLSNFRDAEAWAIVSRSPRLAGSPYANGKPLFKVKDKEEEARQFLERRTIRRRADEILDGDISFAEMADMYRALGNPNPENMNPERLLSELAKIAERSPKTFVELWESGNRSTLMVFKRCLSLGVINYDIARGGYLWKNLPIGLTEPGAVDYLVKNPTILQQADMESKSKDTYVNNFNKMSPKEQAFWGDPGQDDDPELVELRAVALHLKIDGFMKMSKSDLEASVENASKNSK